MISACEGVKIDENRVKIASAPSRACVYEKIFVSLHPKWIKNNKPFFLFNFKNLMYMEKKENIVEKAKKISKGWLESLKTQGSIIINDPALA